MYIDLVNTLISSEMECPLCLGEGRLKRSEILDRLGVKDFARVAQLSAEEAIRLLLTKHKQDEQTVWARFETELTKRTAEISQRHKDEIHSLTVRTQLLDSSSKTAEQQRLSEIQHANRRVEDTLRELSDLRKRNQELEVEMSKVVRIGRLEEMDFAAEVSCWPGISISQKLPKNGDFILAYRDPSGATLEPRMLVDCKDKTAITEPDIKKLIRDAKDRQILVGVIVAKNDTQLRQVDRECRWAQEDGTWILRTTRNWFRRDFDVLRPFLERMWTEGTDFLQKNAAVGEEVRRTLIDLDEVEKELKKAGKAIETATVLTSRYKIRLRGICDTPERQPRNPSPKNGAVFEALTGLR